MKYFILIVVFFSSGSHAISCGNYDKHSQSISDHFAIAAAVFLGTVIEAKYDHENIDGSEIELVTQVNHAFKGSLPDNVKLFGSLEFDRPVQIGCGYIFYNCGEPRIDSICGYLFKAGPFVTSLNVLKEELRRSKEMGYFESFKDLRGIEELINVSKEV